MAGMMTRLGLGFTRGLLSLHYKVEVKNIEAVKGLKGGMICPDHIATVFEALDITAEVYPVDGRQLQLTGPVELTFKAWAPWPKEAQARCQG